MAVKNTKLLRVACAGAVLAVASVAFGQAEKQESKVEGSFDRPLMTQRAPQAQPGVRRHLHMVQREGGRTFEVEIRDDEVTARVDGEEVAAERVRRHDDRVDVLDEDGRVMATLRMPEVRMAPPSRLRVAPLRPELPARPRGELGRIQRPPAPPAPPAPPPAPPAAEPPPPVMIGITMSENDVLGELGVEEGAATRVDRVIEGLPAARAGLRAGDVIVSIEGERPAGPARLREVLRGKKHGDELVLGVNRGGEEREVRLKLQRYEAEKLNLGLGGMGMEAPDEARRMMEEARRWQQRAQGGGGMPGRSPREMELFRLPPGAEAEGMESRLAELDKRLAELEERLKRLDAVLERLERPRE